MCYLYLTDNTTLTRKEILMNNLESQLYPFRDENGNFLGYSLITGEPVITNFSLIDREINITKDNLLSLGNKKKRKKITSINKLQKELAKLAVAVHKSIVANKVYIRSEEECGAEPVETGFHFEMPRLNDYFIHQLVFDILYDKFLRESPKLTLNQYCEKRHGDLEETQNTLNKLMALQIELELGKVSQNGEVKKGIYDNTELIRDAEEFGCNLTKYIEEFRSQNKSFTGKRNKKASEYKPRRECAWDYVFYNGNSKLITAKQFRRLLEHDSNYSYTSFVEEFKAYDKFVHGLFKPKENNDEDYFLKAMGFYHLEIYKRLDFIYKLALEMENRGVAEIDKNHFLIRRFYPHVYFPCITKEQLRIIIKRRYYRPFLFIERDWMKLVDINQSDANRYFFPTYKLYLIRAIIYELFCYNFNFVPKGYKAISNFIRKHYNVLNYHDPNKIWNKDETTKLNPIRITNAQKINKALFEASDKRPPIKKGKKI